MSNFVSKWLLILLQEEPTFRLDHDLVVDAELALGHSGQVGLHDDLSGDVGAQDLTLRAHQEVDVLQDVEEQLVATVLDALAAPTNLSSDLWMTDGFGDDLT